MKSIESARQGLAFVNSNRTALLIAAGALTAIPALRAIRRARDSRRAALASPGSRVERDPRLVGAHRFPRKGDDEFA